jgi:hypothetical protein
MSDFEIAIGKAVADVEFRKKLFSDAEATLKEYKLSVTPDELERLKGLDTEAAGAAMEELQERTSKWGDIHIAAEA